MPMRERAEVQAVLFERQTMTIAPNDPPPAGIEKPTPPPPPPPIKLPAGWECPRCRRILSPVALFCPCSPGDETSTNGADFGGKAPGND